MAVALRLAAQGWLATVCEQGASFGGKMNRWSNRGFRFDTGPSLITMPWVFADLFTASGSAIEDHLELIPIDPISEYVYADGVRFSYSASMPEWLETIRHLDARDGVRSSDNGMVPADVVVMNGDASCVSEMLGEKKGNGLPPGERSLSGFVMLLGVKRTMPGLSHHAIYFSADYRREFSELFDERRFPNDPTVYVNAPSRSDRSVVPGCGETLFVMANAPANDDDEWD